MTVFDLEEMELCYAPQFGSAKDPVNMAGFVAGGLLRGDHPQSDWESIAALANRPLLLDVRMPLEYVNGHIPGASQHPRGRTPDPPGRVAEGPRHRRLLSGRSAGLPRHPNLDASRFRRVESWRRLQDVSVAQP